MKTITQEIVQNKKVLIRIDTDVPIDNGIIQDDSRLQAVLPTLQLLIKHAASVTVLGHLGRPKGQIIPELSIQPIATKLSELLKTPIEIISNYSQRTANYSLLENLRFDSREESVSDEFAQELADTHDIFIFEAFAVSHRAATSTTTITKYLPSYAGLRLTQEVSELSKIIDAPEHPFLAIIGGAKIETKLPTVEKLQSVADHVFVGGRLPHEIKEKNLSFPSNVSIATMNESGLDINQSSIEQLLVMVQNAQLIVWNGPLGKFEDPTAQAGTKALCEALKTSPAYKIIGGGETINAVNQFQATSTINFISVGGGAMLEFLSGKHLPGLISLL